MRVDRRAFLRLLGVSALLAPRARGAPDETPVAPRAPAIHSRTRNTALGALGERRARLDEPGPYKVYPDAARVALPRPERAGGRSFAELIETRAPAPGSAAERLGLAGLARLLHLTNGVTGRRQGVRLRAAPSAGALYAGEVYVVAGRVPELAPGLYYYDVAEHALLGLRSGPLLGVVAEALETPDGVGDAAAVVLLTNVFRRYSARYRNRGYRYALIDSGHIGENLRLAARSLGLRETAPLRFHDDALSALLGIDGREEAVCAVHALGALGPPPAPAAARTWVEKQRLDAGAREGGGPVTRRYHEATKLVPAADPGDARPPAAAGSAAPPAEAAALTLSMGPAPQLPLEDAILGRRSPDGFAARPVSAADLAFVLRAAGGQPALQRAPGVDLYVFAHRVTGVAPGLYRCGPGSERLSLLRGGDLRRTLVEVCWGQAMAGSSAAALVMVARFEVSDSRLGTRHYRDQLLEAGSIGQRVYLAAEALGLAARNLAAFLDDDLNGLLGLDPRRAGAVHLTVFGSEGA